MLADLNEASLSPELDADVIIVGGGLVGLMLARDLNRVGRRVVVLEAGPEKAAQTEFNDPVEFDDWLYGAAIAGRAKVLGGTSTIWGGALLPPTVCDFDRSSLGWNDEWPLAPKDVLRHIPDIEKDFGLDAGTYQDIETPPKFQSIATLRRPKWPKFSKRNSVSLAAQDLKQSRLSKVITNCSVTELLFSGHHCIGVVGRSPAGGRITVKANLTVICAGALESTRLLKLAHQKYSEDAPLFSDTLGKYLHDHISAPVLRVQNYKRSRWNDLAGFRFSDGGMRSSRLEIERKWANNELVPGAFVHFAFESHNYTGFSALREILQSLQGKSLPSTKSVFRLLVNSPWFGHAALERILMKRVLPAYGSMLRAHLVIEQCPVPENKICLSANETDQFGNPALKVNWRVTERDMSEFLRVANLVSDAIEDHTTTIGESIRRISHSEICDNLKEGGGIYHPAGSTKMGHRKFDSVLNADLRPHGVRGLRVLSTSAFPYCTSTNPSMLLLAFGKRMFQQISDGITS